MSTETKKSDALPVVIGLGIFALLAVVIPILWPLWIIIALSSVIGARKGLDDNEAREFHRRAEEQAKKEEEESVLDQRAARKNGGNS